MQSMVGHDWKCWLWKLLWAASAVSLVLAWWALQNATMVWGLDSGHWFLNAFAFALLAIPIKLDCFCSGCKA